MSIRSGMGRFAACAGFVAIAVAASGCAAQGGGAGSGGASSSSSGSSAQNAAPEPQYASWTVYINDDQSYTAGGITRSIALNLTATNPTADAAGTYTGSATAKTTTSGEVNGKKLDASAIANSSNLSFTLQGAPGTGDASEPATDNDGSLAPLTADYTGTGSITMAAGGSATVTGGGKTASGGFGNTSSQQVRVAVNGSDVSFSVDIGGHTFTFKGTLSGQTK